MGVVGCRPLEVARKLPGTEMQLSWCYQIDWQTVQELNALFFKPWREFAPMDLIADNRCYLIARAGER